MSLLASFNGGPPDSVAKMVVAGAFLLAIGLGYATHRIVAGALLGGLSATVACLVMMAVWGGSLGAEIVLIVFGVAGAVCGGVAGLAGRLVRSAIARRRDARSTPVSHD
jgi:hypothetical protein